MPAATPGATILKQKTTQTKEEKETEEEQK
jgi:hypothetical protein